MRSDLLLYKRLIVSGLRKRLAFLVGQLRGLGGRCDLRASSTNILRLLVDEVFEHVELVVLFDFLDHGIGLFVPRQTGRLFIKLLRVHGGNYGQVRRHITEIWLFNMLLCGRRVIRFLAASAILLIRPILRINKGWYTATCYIQMEGLRWVKWEVEVARSGSRVIAATTARRRRRRSTRTSRTRSKVHSRTVTSFLGTAELIWRRLIIVVTISEPAVASLVLHIKIAILNYDQIHVLPDTDRHEDEGKAHELADVIVL